MNDIRHQPGSEPERHGKAKPGDALAGPIGPNGQPVYDHVPAPKDPLPPKPAHELPPDPDPPSPPEPPHHAAHSAHAAPDPSEAIHGTLRTIKWVVIAILALAVVAGTYFLGSGLLKRTAGNPTGQPTPAPSSVEQSNYPAPSEGGAGGGAARSISCLSETGPDATTTSRTFGDVPGTECVHRTGSTKETLVLNGKLTGRNTEGTGMSVTLNVNGKDCNGGEALSYSRTYAPMYSNCTFTVPANSAVGIKWRYLSPFGGTAAVLRSSRNIAPSINGVAIPNTSDQP